MKYYLEQVINIFRDEKNFPGMASVETPGKVTGAIAVPKCGLYLKKGDLIVRHDSPPHTAAIDKVFLGKKGELRLRRALGSFEDSPSIKGKYITIETRLL